MPLLAALGAGAGLGALFASAASDLARAPVIDGVASGDGALALARAAWVGAGFTLLVIFLLARSTATAAVRWGGAALLAAGIAALVCAAYVLTQAQTLAAQARARAQYNTPGLELALLLGAVALLALARRKRR